MQNTGASLAEIESKDLQNAVLNEIKNGNTVSVADYSEDSNNFAGLAGEYDIVIYKISDRPRYLIGAAVSQAICVLKPGGSFVVDYSGFVTNLNEVRVIAEFGGFIYKGHDTRHGVLTFRKPLPGESHELNIEIDMVEE